MKMIYEVKQTHCGQYKRYGDFFREWKITTDESDIEKVKQYCFENLYKELPESNEWHKNIRGKMQGNDSYYFRGYYTLKKVENGYLFIVCEPYTD